MSSDPDPHATAPSTPDFATDERERFARRFLRFALKKDEQDDNPAVLARREAIRQQAETEIAQLRREFADHPMQNYDEMDSDARAAILNDLFKDVEITKVSDTCTNISINGVVEIDPTSLRLMAPHKRAEIFEAANMDKGSDAQIKALKKLGGPQRLRTDMHAAQGEAHLTGLAKGEHKKELEGLYARDGETHAGAYRAFDIGNKLSCYKEGTDAYELAKKSQAAMLSMAMTMAPQSLSEMVVNFEFAEMTFDASVKTRAQVVAQERVAAEQAAEVQKMRTDLARIDALRAQADVDRQALDDEERRIAAITPAKNQKKPRKALAKARVKQDKHDAYLQSLTPANIDAKESETRPVAITKLDKASATEALNAEMSDNEEARIAIVATMEATLRDYTEAVPLTDNASGSIDVVQNMEDITLNALVAARVAAGLRFGSDRTAGYHTLKHHGEMADTSEANSLGYDTDVKNKVAHYHNCARAAVESGEVIQSAVSQNGGESHLYKHRGVTAIVWMNKKKAGLATFFKKG